MVYEIIPYKLGSLSSPIYPNQPGYFSLFTWMSNSPGHGETRLRHRGGHTLVFFSPGSCEGHLYFWLWLEASKTPGLKNKGGLEVIPTPKNHSQETIIGVVASALVSKFYWIHPGRSTAGTYSHHPFRKENDLNQTSMRKCSILIFRGVNSNQNKGLHFGFQVTIDIELYITIDDIGFESC